MNASQRRAAGEAGFWGDAGHVAQARRDMRWDGVYYLTRDDVDCIAALLRALVIATLLDPATWARPEGWRP